MLDQNINIDEEEKIAAEVVPDMADLDSPDGKMIYGKLFEILKEDGQVEKSMSLKEFKEWYLENKQRKFEEIDFDEEKIEE